VTTWATDPSIAAERRIGSVLMASRLAAAGCIVSFGRGDEKDAPLRSERGPYWRPRPAARRILDSADRYAPSSRKEANNGDSVMRRAQSTSGFEKFFANARDSLSTIEVIPLSIVAFATNFSILLLISWAFDVTPRGIAHQISVSSDRYRHHHSAALGMWMWVIIGVFIVLGPGSFLTFACLAWPYKGVRNLARKLLRGAADKEGRGQDETTQHAAPKPMEPRGTRLCPECGKPLRTPLAKQCLSCGADWH
jgi:hypothetical protein